MMLRPVVREIRPPVHRVTHDTFIDTLTPARKQSEVVRPRAVVAPEAWPGEGKPL